MMEWASDWPTVRAHHEQWWRGEGLVIATGAFPARTPHEDAPDPGAPPAGVNPHAAPQWRAQSIHHAMVGRQFLGDTLPLASIDIGPGSLALLLGSEPGFSPETVWFKPTMKDDDRPEDRPPLRIDPDNRWMAVHEQTARTCADLAAGRYGVGCPDLVENIDILAALRDPQRLLMDMIERPGWVERKVWEINDAFFEAYSRIYDIIRFDDGSACFGAFGLWGAGRTAKVQCDASAMFSPAMFERFVVPALSAQCEWLDFSMFHLDGHQCIAHLDHLLSIDALDAIEWTPDPQVNHGGHPDWYPMYRRIRDAGKSVQAIGVRLDDVVPLLDAVGPEGMYVVVHCPGDREGFERVVERAEAYR